MKKVLIIDDNLRHSKMISYLFTYGGFKVTCEISGKDALLKFRNREIERPDIILLDIMMPEMDGFEVLKEIKKMSDMDKVPVVMLTALPTALNKGKSLSMGASGFIGKPFKPSDAMEKINKVLENSNLTALE